MSSTNKLAANWDPILSRMADNVIAQLRDAVAVMTGDDEYISDEQALEMRKDFLRITEASWLELAVTIAELLNSVQEETAKEIGDAIARMNGMVHSAEFFAEVIRSGTWQRFRQPTVRFSGAH